MAKQTAAHPWSRRAASILGGWAALAAGAGCQPASDQGSSSAARRSAIAQPAGSPPTVFASAADADPEGAATFLWATTSGGSPPQGLGADGAARFYLERHAHRLGLSPAALATASVRSVDTRPSGSTIVRVGQRLGGIDVHRRELRVLLSQGGDLVALAGRLEPVLSRGPAPFRLSPTEALASALTDRVGLALSPSLLVELEPDEDTHRLQLGEAAPVRVPDGARVKKVYFPTGGQLVPAYVAEFYLDRGDASETECWRIVVSAVDGAVLERKDLRSYDAFTYRVWADPADHRPLDGPSQDFTPYPSAMPDRSVPPFIAPNLVTIEGFNHNPKQQADPWLAPSATQTLGNNVDAYVDRFPPDGFSSGDFRATVTSPGSFDRTYDVLAEPYPEAQTMAGITELFYQLNWLHDWFYDSGFDEKAGNAQQDNFGRGGRGHDPIRAESQDFSGQNNSNMSTPSDGLSPKMQIFDWTSAETRKLVVNPVGNLATGGAQFGVKSFEVTADVVLVDDGQGTTSDACEPVVNDIKGKVALVDRGSCSYKQQVLNAEAAGAVGVIIADNKTATNAPYLSDSDPGQPVTTAPMSVTLARGNAIKAALKAGAVSATLSVHGQVDRDGTLDNCVVAHEWGHYLHQRLAECAANQCMAMSEGWGDFNALLMVLRDGDNLDGSYGIAPYSARSSTNGAYFGIRRQPYSVDMARDGLTFRHISNDEALPEEISQPSGGPNAEVHNAGEIWATMLFEAYVALQKQARTQVPPASFEDVHRRMTDYVVAGLKLTPADATFTEARDALLAAAAARSKDDLLTLAQAFARRGAGSCAQSPPRESQDFVGVVEDFSLTPRVSLGTLSLDDGVHSCDGDGILDAGEQGHLTIELTNGGFVPMGATTLRLSSGTPGVTFPAGATITVGGVAALTTARVSAVVGLDSSWLKAGTIALQIEADAASACEGSASRKVLFHVNYDDLPQSSASDDLESATSPWSPDGDQADRIWTRKALLPTHHVWRGLDWPEPSLSWLESPDLDVGTTGALTVAFDHRFSFEAAQTPHGVFHLDGGVIEISDDGGTSWNDISGWADPGYSGAIFEKSGNPLAKRPAFSGTNDRWPEVDHVALDLGSAFAGKTIRLRFLIGTDQAGGDFGWELDNFAIGGLTNRPFPSFVDEAVHCQAPDGGTTPQAVPVATGCRCSLGGHSAGAGSTHLIAVCIALVALQRRRRPWTR